LIENYRQLSEEMDYFDSLLFEYQKADDNIYRCILDVEPLPSFLRKPGSGGHDPYNYLKGYSSSELMIATSLRLDEIKLKADLQDHSFKEINRLAEEKKSLLRCRPSIQPISPDNYYWLSSDFGWRIDPFSGMRTFHNGLDFASEPGLNVYATGDGMVESIKISDGGYGNIIVIDHGYGYTSRYAHLQKIFVKPGQKVCRGQIIALLGNSGKSTGPHLHYGVEYSGRSVNPYFYYSDDLSPLEYNKVVSLSERVDN
jgi:murein DD-endopeptidase MepM/ murein hydrolase activator NlpD